MRGLVSKSPTVEGLVAGDTLMLIHAWLTIVNQWAKKQNAEHWAQFGSIWILAHLLSGWGQLLVLWFPLSQMWLVCKGITAGLSRQSECYLHCPFLAMSSPALPSILYSNGLAMAPRNGPTHFITHKIPPFHAFSQQLFFSILGGELGRLEGLQVEKALVMDPHRPPGLMIGGTHRRHTCCLVHCFGLFAFVLFCFW